MKKIIVTGGIGYIGSHTYVDLLEHGFEVISIDNLCRSDKRIIDGIQKISGKEVRNYQIDLKNKKAVVDILQEHADAFGVIHFAAYKSVPESTLKPLMYYRNNMEGLYNILEGMQSAKIQNLIFSSSCSVYGFAKELPIRESTPLGEAQCPYARTKQQGEQVLMDVCKASALQVVLLRYFNPVGAHPSSEIGELSLDTPNNLVPFITQTAIGKREKLVVFGDDYPTRDGSCIRDYIHVCDIAHAHTLALQYLIREGSLKDNPEIFNLGTGTGMSVLEIIRAFERATGQKVNFSIGGRRPGDVIEAYADNHKAKEKLGWEIQYSLEDMMLSAWNWEKKLAQPA